MPPQSTVIVEVFIPHFRKTYANLHNGGTPNPFRVPIRSDLSPKNGFPVVKAESLPYYPFHVVSDLSP